MAFTLASHIILVPFGVALPLITLVMHYRGLRRNDPVALLLARRWSAVMAVQFAVGVVTGTVLSFEFGLLWPGLMGKWGGVFGIGFGVEAWAFFLEAVLIAIYLYGWRRLKPRTHFLLGLPLPAAALLGAFGILAANAWMNTPQGFTLDADGNPEDVHIWSAIFTPMFGPQYWHFVVAMLITAGYTVAGVYAVGWLRGRRDRYHRLGFTVPFTLAAVFTPVQFLLGDSIARSVFHKQPVKFAATELVWRTDTHVPEYIFGQAAPGRQRLRRHQDPPVRLHPGRVHAGHQGDRTDLRPGGRPADARPGHPRPLGLRPHGGDRLPADPPRPLVRLV